MIAIDENTYEVDRPVWPRFLNNREPASHKGTYGHALLVAGSYGKMGAAVLAARACLRMGVGLLTVHVPRRGVDIMQVSVPEAMVSVDEDETHWTRLFDREALQRYDAVAVGPVDIVRPSAGRRPAAISPASHAAYWRLCASRAKCVR